MKSTRLYVLVILCGLTPFAASAEWKGEGELGWVSARGNSDTDTFNSKGVLTFTRGLWENESTASFVHSSDDGDTTKNRLLVGNRTLYSLTERDYLFGALRYDRDRFSNFRYQATASVGYGRRLIMTERHDLLAEVGPGARRTKVRDTGETETDPILRGLTRYAWQISETAKFTNSLLVETGRENTFAENETALSVALNSHLALRVGFAVRHNTEVEPEREKTDTLTTVSLVFNFGS